MALDFFPDRFGQSKLRQHLIDSICSGKCHEWDITLLSSLLLFTPGYVLGHASGKKAVEALRKERNDLAHDADILARLSLTEEQFQSKWEIVSASFKVLIELLQGDNAAWRIEIDSIAKEEIGKSALEPLFERVKEDMEHIRDDLEDVRDKESEAMRMAEGAARMSKVAALVDAKIEKLRLESLFNKQGMLTRIACLEMSFSATKNVTGSSNRWAKAVWAPSFKQNSLIQIPMTASWL